MFIAHARDDPLEIEELVGTLLIFRDYSNFQLGYKNARLFKG